LETRVLVVTIDAGAIDLATYRLRPDDSDADRVDVTVTDGNVDQSGRGGARPWQ
jgi:hypothetical protein